MVKRTLLLAVIGVVLACTRIAELEDDRLITIFSSRQHVAFPGIAQLKTGENVVVFREGKGHVSPDGRIRLCRSTGASWTEPYTIAESHLDCRDPSVSVLKDGRVLVNFFQSRYDSSGKLVGSVGCYWVVSYDNARTFTAPRMMETNRFSWTATSDAILQTGDGTLLFPAYGGNPGEKASAFVFISTDDGHSWNESVIAKDSENKIDFHEPALVELPDRTLYCLMRTAGAEYDQYASESRDGGKSWSSFYNTRLKGQAADLHLTAGGILLSAYRDFWPRGVSYSLTETWGKSWYPEKQLYASDGDCAYPSIIETQGRLFMVFYDVFPVVDSVNAPRSAILGRGFTIEQIPRPSGISASCQNNRVTLRWNPVKDAHYYMVYRDMAADFEIRRGYPGRTGNGIAAPASNYYTDYRVEAGKTYYYRITAVRGFGPPAGACNESDPGETVSITVKG